MCSILTPRFLSTRVVFHCFLNGIMNVLFMDISNIIAWSTGLLALIHLLLAQDILQSLGAIVADLSPCTGVTTCRTAKAMITAMISSEKTHLTCELLFKLMAP
jgi:hypothetical protein